MSRETGGLLPEEMGIKKKKGRKDISSRQFEKLEAYKHDQKNPPKSSETQRYEHNPDPELVPKPKKEKSVSTRMFEEEARKFDPDNPPKPDEFE